MSDRDLTPEEIAANVAKTEAETAKAHAEARQAEAEAKRADAEARVFLEDARQQKAEADTAEMSAKKYAIACEREHEARERELAGDAYHHVYRFAGKVCDESVAACMRELAYWSRTCPGCAMEIVFYSPGGSVIAGMALYDYLTDLRGQGHRLTTVCLGYAASMAGIILQAGDHRIMGRESYVLIHEISAATYGKMGQMEDDVKFYKRVCDRVVDIFVKRSGGKLTRARMEKEWRGHDWWLDSDTALKLGVVDEVR